MKHAAPDDDQGYHSQLMNMLSVASVMVGVCLTAFGLVSILELLHEYEVIVDELLAVAALLFIWVTLMCFLGVRTNIHRVWRKFALTLDILFCLGLLVLVAACIVLTWAVI